MNYYEFKAIYCFDGTEHEDHGVVLAEDFSTAMFNIEQDYGNDLVAVALYPTEFSHTYVIKGPAAMPFFDGVKFTEGGECHRSR